MKKIICILFILSLFSLTSFVADATELLDEESTVLLIYDLPDLIEVTENIFTAVDKNVDKISIKDYDKELIKQYKYIVTFTQIPLEDISAEQKVFCIGENFDITGVKTTKQYAAGMEISADAFYQYLNFIEDFSVISKYEGKGFGNVKLSFNREYPFGVKTGNIYYVPYLSEENISTFALGEMLPDFFDNDYNGRIYVIIEDMFAFSDLDMLCKTADIMYLSNIPFVVKVMPIYENTEQHGFKRYVQVLRYVESRMGSIVMAPTVINGKSTDEEIEKRMNIATKALEDEGVTVLKSVEGFYYVDMEYLKEVKSPKKRYENFSFDVGILENLPRSDLQLEQMVANLNGRWYEFGDYREKFDMKTKPFVETPYDDELVVIKKNLERPLFFTVGSYVIVFLVTIVLIIMGTLVYIGRRSYKNKFAKKTG